MNGSSGEYQRELVLNPISRRLRPLGTVGSPNSRALPGRAAPHIRVDGAVAKPTASEAEASGNSVEETALLAQLLHRVIHVPLNTATPAELIASMMALMEIALSTGEVDASCLSLIDPAREHLKLHVTHKVRKDSIPVHLRPLSSAFADLRALRGNPVEIALSPRTEAFIGLPENFERGYCVAVPSAQGPLGTLWAFRHEAIPMEKTTRLVLASIARQLGALLEKSLLTTESAEQQRLSRELKIAARVEVQQSLDSLPRELPIDVAAMCCSHYEIGGDLCDLLLLDAHRLLICVGDASGNSIPAALIMSTVRGALHALAIQSASAGTETTQVVRVLNQVMNRLIPGHQFMSLICGVLDLSSGRFQYTNAGHPAPMQVRSGAVTPIEPHGIVLGVCEDYPWRTQEVLLAPGDQLVFLTDGILEARNLRGELFGPSRLNSLLSTQSGRPAEETLRKLIDAVRQHTLPRTISDDHTALLLRWLAPKDHPAALATDF